MLRISGKILILIINIICKILDWMVLGGGVMGYNIFILKNIVLISTKQKTESMIYSYIDMFVYDCDIYHVIDRKAYLDSETLIVL